MVPDQIERLACLYFDTYEKTYRVLHAPSFWRVYGDFRQDPTNSSSAFVVLLLLLASAVSCIDCETSPSYVFSSSLARENALYRIQVAESWLRRQSTKHSTMEIFQVHCLLSLAKQANAIKRKLAWSSAGDLMRFSMASGLHRDPEVLGAKVSIFEGEMRRRLWATIMELELQASVTRGMPSSLAGFSFDTLPPKNINDEEFGEESQHTPASKSEQEYTAISFLHLSRRSLSLRISLNSTINDFGSPLAYDRVLLESQKIMECIAEIPRWEETKGSQRNASNTMVPRFLLEIQLRQFLIWLHYPHAQRDASGSHTEYSRMVCLNTARTILDRHSTLLAVGNRFLNILRNDIYLATLTICHNLFISIAPAGRPHSTKSCNPADSLGGLVSQHLAPSLFDLIDRAYEMLEDKVLRIGEGYDQLWLVSVAYGLAKCQALDVDLEMEKPKVIERATRMYYKLLAFQEPEPGSHGETTVWQSLQDMKSLLTQVEPYCTTRPKRVPRWTSCG